MTGSPADLDIVGVAVVLVGNGGGGGNGGNVRMWAEAGVVVIGP